MRRYNLRADERRGSIPRELLDFELLLLWGAGLGEEVELWRVGSSIRAVTAGDLLESGYPNPRGRQYYCVELGEPLRAGGLQVITIRGLEDVLVDAAPLARSGAPVLMRWDQLHKSFG